VELNEKMTRDGKIIPWEDFKAEALKLNDRYNVNHLNAEYQTAKQAAYHASNWEVYLRDEKRFPNLKYRTQGDDRVRDDHHALDGIIAPVGSEFWKKYYPPNGWRCRCYVVQSAEKANEKLPEDLPSVKPEFQLNVGISGQIFNEGDESGKPVPYFALAKTGNLEKAFEQSKEFAPYEVAYKARNGAKVEINIFADQIDLPENFKACKLLADQLKLSSKIRPHINLKGVKNPELEINGVKGDRISPKTKNVARAISNAFDNKLGKGQQLRDDENVFLVIDMNFELSAANLDLFARQSWSKMKHYSKVEFILVTANGKAININRKMLQEGYETYKEEVLKMATGK
jgi:SPP1 gp7 family putative phage head morphogenesis protein